MSAALRTLDARTQAPGVPILAYAIDGSLTDDDVQSIRSDLGRHETVRLLVRIDRLAVPDLKAFSNGLLQMKAAALGKIERYAVVGGPGWIGSVVGVAGALMPFGMRHFDDEAAARAWIGGAATADEVEDRQQADAKAAPAVTLLPSHRSDLVAFHVDGHLTTRDYDAVATPAIEAALREHDAIDLLVRFGTLDGATLGAVADDAALATHLGSFRRLALVTPPDWLASMTSGADALMPVEVETFDQEAQARAWLNPSA